MTKFAKIAAVAVVALGGFAFASVASAVSASSIYSPATGFLKMGSGMGSMAYQAPQVMAAQTALNACVPGMALAIDGKMGPLTTAKFKAFQASKMIAQDGIIGPITAAQLAACSGDDSSNNGGSTNNGTTLNGGAGDLTLSPTNSGVQSNVKEDGEENILGLKAEADDSDIKITNVKVDFQKTSGTGSTRFDKYVEEVKIFLGDEEVGSADADDFSKDGSRYSKTIALDGAVIEEGDEERLYVAVATVGTVDDDSAVFTARVTTVRYEDATGAILSDNGTYTDTFGFDEATADDKLTVKSNSDNPAASTLKVESSSDSDEYLVFAARLEADEDGSDITLNEVTIKVKMDDPSFASTSSTVDSIIKTLTISIDGEEFDLDMITDEDADGANFAIYTADIDGDLTIDAGDTVDVEVMAVFNETDGQDAYGNGTTLDIQFAAADIDADGADELESANLSGTQNSKTHSLNESTAEIKNFSWSTSVAPNGGNGILDFFFTVEADDEDFDVLASSVIDTASAGFSNAGSFATDSGEGVLTRISGDTVTNIGSTGYTVSAGDTVRFRVRYSAPSAGSYEATIDSVAGVEVSDAQQVSPTLTV